MELLGYGVRTLNISVFTPNGPPKRAEWLYVLINYIGICFPTPNLIG